MKETIKHTLGLCEDISHPNIIKITAIVLIVGFIVKFLNKTNEKINK
jgi:hypothetical protein